jgi:hypothetical protein
MWGFRQVSPDAGYRFSLLLLMPENAYFAWFSRDRKKTLPKGLTKPI